MKLIPLTHFRPALARLAVVAALGLGVSSPAFGVVLNISGGSGTPLSFTLPSPVSYTITQATPNFGPAFIFQGVGNLFAQTFPTVTGTITYSVNGGPATTISNLTSGWIGGAIGASDLYFFGALTPLAVGNTVVLSAGTVTMTTNFAGAAPASGNFQTFIANSNGGANISTFGTTVSANTPDAGSTAALLGLGLMGLFSFARVSRRAA